MIQFLKPILVLSNTSLLLYRLLRLIIQGLLVYLDYYIENININVYCEAAQEIKNMLIIS